MDSYSMSDELSILETLFRYLVSFSPESEKQSYTATQTQDIVISGAWIDLVQITINTDGISSFMVNFWGVFNRDSNGGSSNLRLRVAVDGQAMSPEAGIQALRTGETIPITTIIKPIRGQHIVAIQAQKQGNSRDARLNANLNEFNIIEI